MELKDMLTHTHHRWWCFKKDTKIDELVQDFLKTNAEVEQLIQTSNVELVKLLAGRGARCGR